MTANELLTLGLTNAALATLLAVCGWCLTRVWKNPHVASVVWLVVLLKLVTPPVIPLPIVLSEGHPWSESLAPRGEIPSDSITLNEVDDVRRTAGVSPPSASPVSPPSILVNANDESLPSTSHELATEPPLAAFESSDEVQGASAIPLAPPTGQYGVEPTTSSRPIAVSLILLAVWSLGIAAMAGLTTVRVIRFRRSLKTAAVSHDGVQQEALRVARQLKLSRVPTLRFIEASVGPMVWAGAFRPIVVVPRPLWMTLATDERETLLAHEFAHIVRRDHWVRRFEAVVLALFWWLPTAWFVVRRREAAAERCCDALVLSAYPERPQAYAQALFHAVSLFSTGRPLPLASGLGRITELKERLAMIAHDKVPTKPSRLVRMGLLFIAVAALAVSTRFVLAKPGDELSRSAGDGVSAVRQVGLAPVSGQIAGEVGYGMMGAEGFEAGAGEMSGASESFALNELLPEEGSFRGSYGEEDGYGVRTTSGMRGAAAGRGIPLPRSTGRRSPRSPQVRPSDEAVAKMLAGLAKVIESPKESAEVKIQALRSYGRLARGTSHAQQAGEVLFAAAKNANDDRTKLGIAEALYTLGSPKGVELMWTVFGQKPDVEGKNLEARQTAYRMLDKAEAVPPTVESVRLVAEFLTTSGSDPGAMMGGMSSMMGGTPGAFGPGGWLADGPLKRLTTSPDGIRRLVEATESLPKDDGAMIGMEGYGTGSFGMAMGGGMASALSPRDVLLNVLKATAPANEEIATALVEALTSEDAGVRAAAAEALGNVSEVEEPDVSGYIGKGEEVFNTVDRNSDGNASVEELKAVQRLRTSFERAGFGLERDVAKEEFLKAFEKAAIGIGGAPTEADVRKN